ncbi:ABC transporter substrate-binding protein [uncultured Ruminococcus sp.]|uniref:ABC transporter substrate-binding protein n=1 Tax=uncultured Ruminococcus sp. TaxID=165186 RepID=UPI0025CD6240|nr:ABC transporter substrate-binding protein [uncultured Ruminococcus sp.]
MKKLTRILAALMALTTFGALAGCGSGSDDSSKAESSSADSAYKEKDDVTVDTTLVDEMVASDPDIKGQTIYWLADYDLNPTNNQDRSVALSLFEDKYGAKVEYVSCTSDTKFDTLASRILGGDPVDMFPYEWDAVPNGVTKDQYQPLDDYLDLSDDIWSDMTDVIDMFQYKGKHYVVPYCLSDPLLLTYSRSMCEENGLDDPYELYKKDKWNWDAFTDMMKTFVGNAGDGETRYGINGWFGQAMVQSTGEAFVTYDGTKFANNISSPAIERAEDTMEEIMNQKLYDPTWYGYLPDDNSTLFFGMADWALGASNVKHDPDPEMNDDGFVEENDLMIVPFPVDPEADQYYLNCNFAAKMLVKGSDKGDAVAAYIKCERMAAMIDEYQDAAKEKAIIPNINAQGKLKSYVTEEQYDALQDYKDPKKITPVFDFGYGMGSRMYGDGDYTYETRGVMNNLTSALLNGDKDSWAVLRDEWKSVIDEVIDGYNNQ